MEFSITSSAFNPGSPIPVKYTADGNDVSPPLSFSFLPQGTQELALICDDPDAPTPEPWVHWIIYNIPDDAVGLLEDIKKSATVPQPPGAQQGKNSWSTTGYRGPAPPPAHGVHHYHFKLYALDAQLILAAGLDKNALLAAIKDHILAETELVGTFQR